MAGPAEEMDHDLAKAAHCCTALSVDFLKVRRVYLHSQTLIPECIVCVIRSNLVQVSTGKASALNETTTAHLVSREDLRSYYEIGFTYS